MAWKAMVKFCDAPPQGSVFTTSLLFGQAQWLTRRLMFCICYVVSDGVLWCWFDHRPGEEHQREPAEGGLDRLHL